MSEAEKKLVERFAAGQLSGPQLADFWQRCERDPDFKKEAALHVAALEALLAGRVDELRSVFAEPGLATVRRDAIRRERRRRLAFAIAGGLAILVCCFITWKIFRPPLRNSSSPDATPPGADKPQLPTPGGQGDSAKPAPIPGGAPPRPQAAKKPKTRQLFAEHFQPYENTYQSTTRNENTSQHPFFEKYTSKDYRGALSVFPAIAPDDNWAFYQANALLAVGRCAEAIPILERLAGEKNIFIPERAVWYLALAQLCDGKTDSARVLLRQLANDQPNAYKQLEAEKLLRQIAGTE